MCFLSIEFLETGHKSNMLFGCPWLKFYTDSLLRLSVDKKEPTKFSFLYECDVFTNYYVEQYFILSLSIVSIVVL